MTDLTGANSAVARAFALIADLLEIRGGDEAAKGSAYRRAARSVDARPGDVAVLHREGRLRDIPGVGDALARKIAEFLDTGRIKYLERLSDEVPPGVLDFLRIPGIGTRTAGLLWRELGVTNVDQLEAAAKAGLLRGLPGFGPKKEEALLEGVAAFRRGSSRFSLGLAGPAAAALAERVEGLPGVDRAAVAGSTRRWKETVGNIDVVAAASDPPGAAGAFEQLPGIREVLDTEAGPREVRVRAILQDGLPVDVRFVPPERYWAALNRFTGSAAHTEALVKRAERLGLGMGEDGPTGAGGERLTVSSEDELYRHLGLPLIPPELREGSGEVETAAVGGLPRLVEREDIRGDLHVHSNWSDGTASLEALAGAARALGYEYLGICDHSKALAMARGLDEKRLLEQGEAIEQVNAELAGEGSRLLAGIEVDILSGGELDLPDTALADLDIVTASVHSGLRQPGPAMTERLVKAAENEHVDVLGHPTGRLIGRREPSQLDLAAVLDAAAAHGTMLEMNASPDRLDLKDADAGKARRRGCLVTISTDAHHPRFLEDMSYGVATARRAWLEPPDVANTRSWSELKKLLKR